MSSTSKKVTKPAPAIKRYKARSIRAGLSTPGGENFSATSPLQEGRSKLSLLQRAKAARDAISDEENAAITAAARTDPDAQPNLAVNRRGRPLSGHAKVPILLRLDPDVIATFKAGGTGWQTRMNAALRRAAGLDE